MPGPNVPFPPMEAQLVETLPEGERWQYEPKWDGFRGVLENDGGELALWSRNERPLLRYFPELRKLGDLMPPHSALDGEIVIELDGKLEFDAMQNRLHPAESRIRKLSAETPARYIVFDILLWNGEPIHERPLAERRKELERLAKGFSLSPVSKDPKLAEFARGADVLVHECLYVPAVDRLVIKTRNGATLKKHLLDSHTTTEDVGRIAAAAGVKVLVLSHFVPGDDPLVTDDNWTEDVKKNFSGRIIVAKDLMQLALPA